MPTSYARVSPHGLLTMKRRCVASVMNFNSTHSPRSLWLLNRCQYFISPLCENPTSGNTGQKWGTQFCLVELLLMTSKAELWSKQKGATGRPRLSKNCFYIQDTKLGGVNRKRPAT